MSALRQVVKDILVYSAGDLFLRATAFVTLPIYTRILSPADYGVWAYATSAVGLLTAFLILGGDSAYARFYFEARTLEAKRALTSTWFSFLAIWSLGIVLVVLPLAGTASNWAFDTRKWGLLIALTLLTAPLSLMNTLLGQVLRNDFKPKLYTVTNVASALATVVLGLVFAAGLDWGITGIAAGGLAGALLTLPPRIWYARHLLRPTFRTTLLGALLRYGLPLVPGTVAWWIFGLSDRIVLGRLSTLKEVGLYSVANSVTTPLALFVGSLGMAWSPHAVRLYEERPSETPGLFGRMLTYIIVGFGVLAVSLTAFAHDMLAILATSKFLGAASAVGPLALAFIASASIQVTAMGISLKKRTGYLAVFAWLAALLNLGLNIAFVPRFGMLASAWATFASYAFLTVAYFVVSQRLWRVEVERWKALAALAVTCAFTVAVPLLPDISLAPAIAMKLGYIFLCGITLIAVEAVDRREVASVLGGFRRALPGRRR